MLDAVVVKVRPCLSTHLASPYLIPLWPLLAFLPTVVRQGVCHHRPPLTPRLQAPSGCVLACSPPLPRPRCRRTRTSPWPWPASTTSTTPAQVCEPVTRWGSVIPTRSRCRPAPCSVRKITRAGPGLHRAPELRHHTARQRRAREVRARCLSFPYRVPP